MSGTIKTPIVSTEEGYLPEFMIGYRSIRMVLWTAPDFQIGGLTMRATEKPIGALYKLKEVGYFFVDLAGNGAMYETFAQARDDLARERGGH